MPKSCWQDAWDIGIEVIDAEHRELHQILCDFSEAFCGESRPIPETMPDNGSAARDREGSARHEGLMTALEHLGERAREHFRREETLMHSIDYPDLAAHRSEHVLLLAEYVEMMRDLKDQPVTRFDPETIASLRSWLLGHILAADKAYADYYFALLNKQDAIPD